MEYKLNLNMRAFNAIKRGEKQIEIRANTGNTDYSQIKKGDIIKFLNDNKIIVCRVKDNNWYKSIEELLMLEGTKYTLSSTNNYAEGIKSINSLNGYKETIKKSGVYAIHIEYLYDETDIWNELYEIAVNNLKPTTKEFIDFGGVSAAVLTEDNNIYTGVCIDTSCSIGMCAERNAISSMLNNGETTIKKIVCVGSKKNYMLPCGVCCEFMLQISEKNKDLEMMMSDNKEMTLKEIFPNWWGNSEEEI